MRVACHDGRPEVFGPTIQGEGRSTGQRAVFVRLSTCNLTCVWCDTKYTWDWNNYDIKTEQTALDASEAARMAYRIADATTALLVITGGEPLLQASQASRLALFWHDLWYQAPDHEPFVEIETNGTLAPYNRRTTWPARGLRFNVSPKLANSGIPDDVRIVPDALEAFAEISTADADNRADFKFVVTAPGDLDEITGLVERFNLPPANVWCMPEGTRPQTLERRLELLADDILSAGFNITSRLHVQLWPGERSR